MWYLEQLQEFLNEKFLGTGSPSRAKINDKSNSKSMTRTSALPNMEGIVDPKIAGGASHHRSQRGLDP